MMTKLRVTLVARAVTLALVWVVSLAALSVKRDINADDAFIVLVYARNLVQRGRLEWNALERADGFTSLLDVGVKSLAYLFHISFSELVFYSGVTFYVSAALVAGHLASRVMARAGHSWLESEIVGCLAAVSLAGNDAFAHAGSFFLESQAYGLLVLAVVGFVMFPSFTRWRLALWGALMLGCALARPEGIVIALAAYVAFAFSFRNRVPRARLSMPLAPFGSGVLVYVVWHRLRFGYLAPNTYYAKRAARVSAELADGFSYFVRFLGSMEGAFIVALLVASFVLGWRLHTDTTMRRRLVVPSGLGLLAILMTVWEGGDCYLGSRFFLVPAVLTPVIAVTLACAIARRAASRHLAFRLSVVLACAQLVPFAKSVDYSLARAHALYEIGREARLGNVCDERFVKKLASALPPSAHVGETDWQRFQFFSAESVVVDLNGLNNRRIAHTEGPHRVTFGKFTAQVARDEAPEVLILGAYDWWRDEAPARLSTRDMFHETWAARAWREIDAAYVPVGVPACGRYMLVLVRRDVVPLLHDPELVISRGSADPR